MIMGFEFNLKNVNIPNSLYDGNFIHSWFN